MEEKFNIQEYLANGAQNIIKDAIKVSLKNTKESLFLLKFSKHTKKSNRN